MSTVTTPHIWVDESGVAWIDQTNIKVIEIALERLAHGSSVEEIVDQHDGLLSFAQIHSALAYYYDHQRDYDEQIERQLIQSDQLRTSSLDSPGRRKLRASGRIQ